MASPMEQQNAVRTSESPVHILVVDDDATILAATAEYFRLCGFRIDCASSSKEAKALLGNDQYAVVIADLRLSDSAETDGLDVVRFARGTGPDTHIVVLSAFASEAVKRKAADLGADEFLVKPTRLRTLAQLVSRFVPEAKDSAEQSSG